MTATCSALAGLRALWHARWRVTAALAVWSLAGLAAASVSVVVRDHRGVEHRFEATPRRVVSLLPSLTETLCAVGACDRLVGTDRYSNWPASVSRLPKLGGLDDAVIERIVALQPDVVLASASSRALDRLESLGLRVLRFHSDRHEQVHDTLLRVGALFGSQEVAERAWRSIQADIDQAAARVPPALRGHRVYFETDATPYAASEGSFVGQTLERLQLRNIAAASLGPFPRLSPEFVVQAQPQLIMAVRGSVQQMATRPGWAGLTALRQAQVCAFDAPTYEMLIRPGPRLGAAALAMADCLAALPVARHAPRRP